MFQDRREGGRRLGAMLATLDLEDPIVLALPRGGVPVGAEVAETLHAPLEVFVARKVGAPGHPELGIGAVAEGSERLVLTDQAQLFDLDDGKLQEMARAELDEIARRVQRYRGERSLPELTDCDVVLVDDGLATGVTAEAALRNLTDRGTGRLVLAVPVCAVESSDRLGELAEVRCLERPPEFRAVGLWYRNFGQTTDDEVVELLEHARVRTGV